MDTEVCTLALTFKFQTELFKLVKSQKTEGCNYVKIRL